MSDLFSSIYAPLDKNSCLYFLLLTLIFFFGLIIAFVANIFYLIKNRKEVSFRNITTGLMMLFNIYLAYFVNRLLYTMCVKSLA